MIPFPIEFIRCETVDEAIEAWRTATATGKTVRYYGGGTEFVTLARESKIHADVVIDYKGIPEARDLCPGGAGDDIYFGAALRLNEIVDGERLGLFSYCAAGVADRTVRNSITFGGNVAGMLPYREAILPFLLLDGTIYTQGPGGLRIDPIRERCRKRIVTEPGELILGVSVERSIVGEIGGERWSGDRAYGPVVAGGRGTGGGWYYFRRTKEARLDYPLATIAVVRRGERFRIASTGTFGFPTRGEAAEGVVSEVGTSIATMTDEELRTLAATAWDAEGLDYKDDMRGSGEYRREIAIHALAEGLRVLTGERGA